MHASTVVQGNAVEKVVMAVVVEGLQRDSVKSVRTDFDREMGVWEAALRTIAEIRAHWALPSSNVTRLPVGTVVCFPWGHAEREIH